MDFVKSEGSNTQAAILIRGSSIIAEYYADNFDKDSIVTSWSVAKSFTSTLIGIAIDEGYIKSIEDPITDYLPEWKGQDQDKILLKHLLSMRSGMEDHGFVYVVNDMISHSLDRDVIRPPEIAFRYSNEDSMLLGEIIQNATGMSFQEYADKKLFNLLDVNETWWTDQKGNTISYASIDMTPREFAKFGLMIAQEGSWQGQQIVSSDWVELATSKYDDLMSYGFQWWTSETGEIDYPFFSARGLDGQLIYIWPETDLVFVRFTTYKKIGDQDSSVVRINSVGDLEASYQQTETGNLNTIKLEELLYDIGDNLIMASDLIATNDFG
jgi:CubicO group peptidase (beta-lactamase class C family)